jgi:hypothetical protein
MEFRRAFQIPPLKQQLNIRHGVMLVGSCFTDHLGNKLQQHRFSTLQNPNGILFNPVSLAKSVTSYIEKKHYNRNDLFFQQEWWTSWDHHSQFSHANPEMLLEMINRSQDEAHLFLQKAKWIVLTVGSAWVYQLAEGTVVANCHKVPTDKFQKRLLPVEEVLAVLDNMIHRLFIFNPGLRILFTISPVRHLRDGFVENNRSKAVLIQAVHHLVEKFEGLFYFPAYELIIDDLRDYRFYAEDMVHPNYLATNYVWEKFSESCIDEESRKFIKEIAPINAALAHKPFQPNSNAHKLFRQKQVEKLQQLQTSYPFLDFEPEIAFFKD